MSTSTDTNRDQSFAETPIMALTASAMQGDRERALAEASRHLCPSMLAGELAKLERAADIFITHLKPGEIELTMQEIGEDAAAFRPKMLKNGQIIEF